jgi:AAA domain
MRYKIVPVKNITLLAQAGEALINRQPGAPGMGLVYGRTGAGKTTACAWFREKVNGVYVRAMALWTPFMMMEAIATELGVAGATSTSKLLSAICASLKDQPRPLIIDEADYLVDRKTMIETLRDLHDDTTSPVILIGMDGIERTIQQRRQLSGRILRQVPFHTCDLTDTHLLAEGLCEVGIESDMLENLHRRTKGSPRLIMVGLSRLEEKAKALDLPRIGLAQWGESPLFLGD